MTRASTLGCRLAVITTLVIFGCKFSSSSEAVCLFLFACSHLSISSKMECISFKPERHRKDLPGSPDAVLPRTKVVLFVNGCFWHGHRNCSRASLPSTNRVFWKTKIEKNKRRDVNQQRKLRKMGWCVLTFWTCKPLTQEILVSRLRRYARRNGASSDTARTKETRKTG